MSAMPQRVPDHCLKTPLQAVRNWLDGMRLLVSIAS